MLRRGKDRASVRVELDADRAAVEAARRDPRAFEALYRKYVAQVYNFALYELRDPHAAEDVTAHVFLRALAGLPRFQEQTDGPGSSFRLWLFQIARNSLSNERRRARRHPQTSLDLALEVPSSDDVAQAATRRAEVEQALSAIDDLPHDRRRALLLRFVNELSTREISQIMGRSEPATRVLIHRSLQSVARHLGRHASTPAHTKAGRSRAAH